MFNLFRLCQKKIVRLVAFDNVASRHCCWCGRGFNKQANERLGRARTTVRRSSIMSKNSAKGPCNVQQNYVLSTDVPLHWMFYQLLRSQLQDDFFSSYGETFEQFA